MTCRYTEQSKSVNIKGKRIFLPFFSQAVRVDDELCKDQDSEVGCYADHAVAYALLSLPVVGHTAKEGKVKSVRPPENRCSNVEGEKELDDLGRRAAEAMAKKKRSNKKGKKKKALAIRM